MKNIFVFCTLLALSSYQISEANHFGAPAFEEKFNLWKVNKFLMFITASSFIAIIILKGEFNKTYTDFETSLKSFNNFKDAYQNVEAHNLKFASKETSFLQKCSSRAELSAAERQAFMNGFILTTAESKKLAALRDSVKSKEAPEPQPSFPPAPDSLDYRELGYVAEVVDQGENL